MSTKIAKGDIFFHKISVTYLWPSQPPFFVAPYDVVKVISYRIHYTIDFVCSHEIETKKK